MVIADRVDAVYYKTRNWQRPAAGQTMVVPQGGGVAPMELGQLR